MAAVIAGPLAARCGAVVLALTTTAAGSAAYHAAFAGGVAVMSADVIPLFMWNYSEIACAPP